MRDRPAFASAKRRRTDLVCRLDYIRQDTNHAHSLLKVEGQRWYMVHSLVHLCECCRRQITLRSKQTHLLTLKLAQPMLQVLALLGLALEEHHGPLLLLLLRPQGRKLALHALMKKKSARIKQGRTVGAGGRKGNTKVPGTHQRCSLFFWHHP